MWVYGLEAISNDAGHGGRLEWMDGWMALVLLEVNGEVPVSFFVFRGHYPLQEFRGATWGGSRGNGG